MSQPNSFILSSDFPTLKNDEKVKVEGTILGGITVPASDVVSAFVDVEVGTNGAPTRCRISSSKNNNYQYVTSTVTFNRSGTVSGSPTSYGVLCFIQRVSATTIRFQVNINNPYGSDLTTEAGDDTITWYVSTFIPPYA